MKLEYNAATDLLYVHLNDRPAVDLDDIGGIDLQHAGKRFDLNALYIRHLPITELLSVA